MIGISVSSPKKSSASLPSRPWIAARYANGSVFSPSPTGSVTKPPCRWTRSTVGSAQQLPQTLAELLAIPLERLRRALVLAIDAAIIPDITGRLDEIIDRMAALRLSSGRLAPRHVTVQLIAVFAGGSERPLAAVDVAVVDLDSDDGDPALGNTTTDRDGVALIGFMAAADAAGNAARRLELTIREDGEMRAVVEITVPPDSERVLVVRVPLPTEPGGQIRVADLTDEALTRRLHDRGIDTLDDLLSNPGVVDEIDPDGVERLRGIATWTALTPDLDSTRREVLIENGILGATDLAARSRADVMRRLAPGLGGDAETYAMFKANRDTRQVLQHHINGVWLSNVTTPGDDDDPEIPDGVNDLIDASQTCGCEDCLTAVSPAAYLAQLLDWVLTHVKDVDAADIEFGELENDLHQPFGRLPASCRAVEEEVRQVRLVVESLWSLTGLQFRTDLQLPTPFRLAYRSLRNEMYRQILTNFGVSFEQLRTSVLTVSEESPDAERIAAERAAVAGRLGIDEVRLNALFFNVEATATSPAEDVLQRLFGYKDTRAENPLALPARAELVEWQRERLEQLWQEQDWSIDAYHGDERLPFVDPEIITSDYLRTPLEANAAFELFNARTTGLAAHRASMEAFAPLENGLDALVEEVLGASIAELRALSATLHDINSSEAQIVAAHASIDALHLTQAGFSHLMGVDARLLSGEPLGESDAEVTAALAVVFDTLSRARRHALFPEWVAEEQSLELVFGPKLFWMPTTAAQPPNLWQADSRERAAWEEALARRSRRPLIDPDQITLSHITVFKAVTPPILPSLTPVQLWEARRGFVDERLEALVAAEEDQPDFETRLQAVLQASTLGIDLDSLRALADLETSGIDLAPHLARIGLTMREYRFLAEIRALTAANAPVGADDRAEIRAILVQAEKRREYAEWRLEEQSADNGAGPLTLHPDRFSDSGDLAGGRHASDQMVARSTGLRRVGCDARCAERAVPYARIVCCSRRQRS